MTYCRVSIRLIEQASSEGWIRQLAFYHLLKSKFNNSCLFNYRSRRDEISEMLGVCTKTLYTYLKFLKEKGLACDHATNFKLKSTKEFSCREKTIISISSNHSINDISCLLYAKLLEQSAKRQAFAESLRQFEKPPEDKPISTFCEIPFRPSISYDAIARILHCSVFKAYQVAKTLVKLGIIEIDKQKPRIIGKDSTRGGCLKYAEDLPGYRFTLSNYLFEKVSNKLNFLLFPVYLKPISLRQYLKYKRLK